LIAVKAPGALWLALALPLVAAAPLPPPPELAASRRLFDSWKAPVPPRTLVGNIHYVGAAGVSSFLVTTPAGHILLDTGFEDTVPLIQRGVEQLGFRLADIKLILGSHAHVDHTGGHALMKKLTGAAIVSSAADARLLATGGADDYSPYPQVLMRYTPVAADRIVRDGETVTLGGVTLTAHLTPGHTRGATTWTMDVDDAGTTRHVVFFSSLSIVNGTSLVRQPPYPAIADDFRASLAKLKSLPCEIWFSPHGGQFAMAAKLQRLERQARPNPFIDPQGWKQLLATLEASFEKQLELENH
jgi:metallo-beta-lactamase class B